MNVALDVVMYWLRCLLLFLLTLTACDLLGIEDDSQDADVLVPLAVGNYWEYHRWYSDPALSDTVREEVLGQHEVGLEGTTYTAYGYRHLFREESGWTIPNDGAPAQTADAAVGSMLYTQRSSPPDYQWLRANGEKGLISFGGLSPTDTLIVEALQYKYPTQVGDEQEYPTLSYDFNERQFSIQDTITIETVGTNETFESEWATYEGCYVYRIPEIGREDAVYWWDHFVYIKPGIGVVAIHTQEHFSEGKDPEDLVIGQWILVDYQLNQ